jgi:predicted MPP superfamily phosphohydrolase
VKSAIAFQLGFFVFFLILMYAVQRFWFVRAWRAIEGLSASVWRHSLHGALIAAATLLLLAMLDPIFKFFPRAWGGAWVFAVCRLWLIASLLGLIAIQPVQALNWITKVGSRILPASRLASVDPARRAFFRYAAYLAGGIPIVAAGYGFARERLKYRVVKVDVPIAGLPKGLDGMRIAQMSDIHAGDFMPPDEVRRAVDMANELGADLAVVTGDFISDARDPLAECIAELSRLQAPLGIWGCNGNHEIYALSEDKAQKLFEKNGMRLLRQQSVELTYGGEKFNLIGVDYQRDHMTSGPRGPMLTGIEQLIRRDIPNILLSHNPNSFHRAAELGIELSLAGHTHGGQVKFEIVDHSVSPARLITDFVAGLYHLPMKNGAAAANGDGRASLYVNRGLGTFGFPVRLGVPPEITLLTLRAA